MPSRAAILRRFGKSTRAVAAVEFAAILPVLATIFLATFDGGRAVATYMKVRAATYALAAITNQYSTIQSASVMSTITGATSVIMSPYPTTPTNPVITITQITISSKKQATVSWSYSQGGTALAQGSSVTVPTNLNVASTYLIFAQVSYTFTPLFGYFGSGGITFSDNLYVTPRISNCVNYPPASVTSCVTG
jgi:Flp pilus assembly protein TadG